ncbi:MAG TPA: hypothetical protein VIU63_00740 [Nitrospira sp.]
MSADTNLQAGIIHTIAGTGQCDLSGDGGPAVSATLNEPKAVALDRQGNLIIADSENHVVRKIDRVTGRILTIAGCVLTTGFGFESGPGSRTTEERDDPFSEVPASGSQAFAHQTDLSGTVRYVTNGAGMVKRFGGDQGPALQALLNFPTAVAIDVTGDLYIADTMNHRIRRVHGNTGEITTVAGTGQPRFAGDGGPAVSAGLNEPAGLAVDASGILYVADQSNNRVRAIDLNTGLIRTVAGTGAAAYNGDGIPATEAALAGPSGIALGADGALLIADTFNGRIRAVDLATGLIRTVIGDGGEYRYQGETEPPSASLSRPSSMAIDGEGNIYITDSDNHLVRRWDRVSERLERVAGVGVPRDGGDGGSAREAGLNYPFGVAVNDEGDVFIADTFNHRIRKIMF